MDPALSLLDIAKAVSDGAAVDWPLAESSAATQEERDAVRALRSLAAIMVPEAAMPAAWGPLKIREEVGRGTFGRVFRAFDPRLDREVALKLIPAAAAVGGTGSSALIAEGRALAKVRHPNVVTVFGADVFDGSIGIWMDFVVGRTLRDVVAEGGPLGAAEAAVVGRDLCRALAAVHKQGLIHQDVKAQNVMREAGGRTVLMDFGTAEAHSELPRGLRGTPAYLAPEVLAGGAPSVQSDIYSLGVLLFYLSTGTFPVVANSVEALHEQHQAGARRRLADLRPDLPAEFVRAVESACAHDADARPATAGALEEKLDMALGMAAGHASGWSNPVRIVIAAAVLLALAGGGLAWRWRGGAESLRDSVAILPLRNLSGDPETDYLAEGITADLIGSLSSLRDLRVIAGASTQRIDRAKTPVEIGTQLGVASVLDASIRRSANSVRIVAQLVDAKTGAQLWSDTFDNSPAEIVNLKSDVSSKIALALRGELSAQDRLLLRPARVSNAQAFDLYFKGRHLVALRTEARVTEGLQYFQNALAIDPSFAAAHAGISDAYTFLGVFGSLPRSEAFARSADAARKAIALDDTLAEAHTSLGYALKNQFDWAASEKSFKRAIELKPGSAQAHQWYSVLLTQEARLPEAVAEAKLAVSLDPLSVGPTLQFASVLTQQRRYADALAQYERSLQLNVHFPTTYRHKALALAHAGRFAEALETLGKAFNETPAGAEDLELKADRGYISAAAGDRTVAEQIAKELALRNRMTGEHVAGGIAAIYSGLGRVTEAVNWLARAHADRDPEIGYLKVDPRWDNLRDDDRFKKIVADVFPR